MLSDVMENKIADIFSSLFGRKISPDADFSMENQSDWDSMKHIEIIMTLEDELNISFEAGDIPNMTSLAEIIVKVKAMQA